MYLVISKCVTAVILSNFSGLYLRNRSNFDIGVLGYIGILKHKEHPPEVWHIPPGTLCILFKSDILVRIWLKLNKITLFLNKNLRKSVLSRRLRD